MTQPIYHEALDVMARTVWGEARGQGWLGKVAVAHVILNRVKADSWWGKDIEGVCTHAWQFSCWNKDDPNLPKLKGVVLGDDREFRECLAACAAAIFDLEPDPTDNCCHYMTIMRREEGWPKHWGEPQEPHRRIGTHLFYKGIR